MLRFFKKYYPIRNLFFVVGEGVFILISVLLAVLIIFGRTELFLDDWLLPKILLITIVCQVCLYYNDLYDLQISENYHELGIRLLQALGFAAILLALLSMLFPQVNVATGTFAVSICFAISLIVSWRLLYSVVLKRGIFNQKIALLGSGQVVKDIKKEIKCKKDCGYTISLEVPERMDEVDLADSSGTPIICQNQFEDLSEIAKTLKVEKVVVGFEEKREIFPIRELLKCRVEGIDIIDGNNFFENLTGKLTVAALNPSWLIFSGGFQKSRARQFLKRSTDLVLSAILLILCSPLFIITAVLIKLDSRGPVFFSQERVGHEGRSYRVHKFRSMVDDAEEQSGPVWAQTNDARVTRVGRFIRQWRVDELPQLWNVLKGEMSFVGPRPEREFFVKRLEEILPFYTIRFTVKPGITGWAQVSYGYGASVEDALEKLNYDLFYIKNMSVLMDLMIVLQTLKIVLFSKGAR
jgi:sugar transferase (PEP-CTERM system associated)